MNTFSGNRIFSHYLLIVFFALSLQACGGGNSGTAPKTPTNVQATDGDQRVTVTWDSVVGATSYNVYWATTSGTYKSGTLVNVTDSIFYHDGLTNGTDYFYVVTSLNSIGESTTSAEIKATPDNVLLSSLVFNDTNLSNCFNAATATLVYVHELKSLSCGSKGITDIGGIEALSSLTNLLLDHNNITDISSVKSLKSLTYLNLGYNNSIVDISAVAGLTKLTLLFLNENNIVNISALKNLTALTWLQLDNNAILDISGVENLTNLTSLTLFRNNISNISGLSNITKLTSLNLQFNSITDVSDLIGLTKLVYLYLNDNSIIDVKPLENIISIKTLWLHNNNISGQGVGNVDSLSSLTNATSINLSNNNNMSCYELSILIAGLNSSLINVINVDNNSATTDTAINGTNCTNF